MKTIFFALTFLAGSLVSYAQGSSSRYRSVDEKVAQFGNLASSNIATIADTITAPFSDHQEKARAIFYWIANNIAIDPKASKQNDSKNTLPEKVVELRKATALGYSLLVQEMCSDVNIRCISVDGYKKSNPEDINQPADEINHSWNVVQLGQSPETWYFVDACSASGYLDKKMTVFTKQFTSEYFFADKKLFGLTFYPDNSAWQLGGGPKNLKEFYALPVICNSAFALGLSKPSPAAGYIKANLKTAVSFSFRVNEPVKSISVIIGDEKKQPKPEEMNFDDNGGLISFTYKFKKEDTAPMKILADGKVILEYMAEVNE